MNFKRCYHTFIIFLLLNTLGCLSVDSEWENLESDFDHVLNVLGIINLDSNQTSFIGIYRTTDLDEVSQIFIGVDTLGYYEYEDEDNNEKEGFWMIDSIYEPAALINDASVFISDDQGNSYEFTFVEKITYVDTIYFDTTITIYGYTFDWDTTIYDTNNFRINFYLDTTGTFNPEPGLNYQLNITAPGYDPVTGSLTTPFIPKIDSLVQRDGITDTIIAREPFDIHWDIQESGNGLITGEVLFDDEDGYDPARDDWCGGFFENSINLSDSSYTVYGDYCEILPDTIEPKEYFIRLTTMDNNYHEYFIEGELGEYSNMLLNYPTTKGRSVGIEGGFGFFGAIASHGIRKTIIPY